jgi:hypothetical protein
MIRSIFARTRDHLDVATCNLPANYNTVPRPQPLARLATLSIAARPREFWPPGLRPYDKPF